MNSTFLTLPTSKTVIKTAAFISVVLLIACSMHVKASPVCGNGLVESGEECEDFNVLNGDGCSALCTIEGKSPTCSFGYTDSIFQNGIAWKFNACYRAGQFANGDYWVLGPVTITAISPDYHIIKNSGGTCTSDSNCVNTPTYTDSVGTFDASVCGWTTSCTGTCVSGTCSYLLAVHGFEINPTVDDTRNYPTIIAAPQGFDSRPGGFSENVVPSLPLTVNPSDGIKSIIKLISRPTAQPFRHYGSKAGVLTVVPSVPPDEGRSVFRPPYVGTEKPYYSANSLQTQLLTSLQPSASTPAIKTKFESMRWVHMDHKGSYLGQWLRPEDQIQSYYPDQPAVSSDAVLRLMLNDPLQDKLPLLYVVVQDGIDNYYFIKGGQTWPAGDSVQPGHQLLPAFAAAMLGDASMKSTLRNSKLAMEDTYLKVQNGTGMAIYGGGDPYTWSVAEEKYWQALGAPELYGKEREDPYRLIDGGANGGGGYYEECCQAKPWKESALPFFMIPEMKNAVNNSLFLDFADRWVNIGIWAQPDPCASPVGVCGSGPHAGAACTLATKISFCNDDNAAGTNECLISICASGSNAGNPCGGEFDTGGTCGSGNSCILNPAHYKVDYGPDPAHPGQCILDISPLDGIGRVPYRHGMLKDGGLRGSTFVDSMWTAYRGPSCYDGKCEGDENYSNCPYDCSKDLVLRIDFENNWTTKVNDKSGYGNNAYCQNNFTSDDGPLGVRTFNQCPHQKILSDGSYAGQFAATGMCDKGGDYLAINNSAALNNIAQGTISVWANYLETPETYATLISAFGDEAGTWHLGGPNYDGWPGLVVSNGSAVQEVLLDLRPHILEIDVWHLYTVSWNTTTLIGYVDGKEVSRAAQKHPYFKLGQYITIGAHSHMSPQNMWDANCINYYNCFDLCGRSNGCEEDYTYSCMQSSSCNWQTNDYCPVAHTLFAGYPDARFPHYVLPNHGYMNGYIDDIRIYRVMLSSSEISGLYNNYIDEYLDPVCGNNFIQPGEVCDGTQLNGKTCQDFGFPYGALMCLNNCSGYSTAYCSYTEPLIGRWNLDEGSGAIAYDSSVNHRNGNLAGGPLWVQGKIGTALQFDGVDDIMDIPYNTAPGPLGVSAAFWMKTSMTSGYVVMDLGGNRACRFGGISPGKLNCYTDGSSSGSAVSKTILNDGVWHHVVMVSTTSSQKLYVDGQQEGAAQETLSMSSGPMRIGHYTDGTAGYFSGVLDDVRLYSIPLTASDVNSIFQEGNNGGSLGNPADVNGDGCVSQPELFAFIDRWKVNNQDVTLKELIEAIGLYKRGGC